MVTDIAVTSGVIATLLAEAQGSHPAECCGLLLGAEVIERALPAANVAADPLASFEIDPAVLLAAHKAARGGGPEIAGYYHSHPNGRAEPSPCDREAASGDGRLWAIVAGSGVTFWRDGSSGFTALPYAIQDG